MYSQQDADSAAREFRDLYARYHVRLVRYCRRRLDSSADAEDAAHEALLRAFQAWSRFDPTTDAWPWLATIAARVCADARRRSARPVVDPGHEPSVDVHEQAVSRLRASIVEDALGHLPPRYRNPLVLKEFAGWSYREIAELEGRSVASVRSTIMRSRKHLSARVEDVARTQGQWPLPAVVPKLADRVRATRRGHVVRTWFERTAQTAAAVFDSTRLLGAFPSLPVHAVLPHAAALAGAAVLAVGGASGPVASAPRPVPPPPKVAVQAAPGAGASVSASVDRATERKVPDVRTVARVDDHVPDNSVLGVGPVEATVEYREDGMIVRVNNFFTFPVVRDTDEPTTVGFPCHNANGQACPIARDVLERVDED
jgi:RNA polymerase sigma factor (sigma-70 family)